ncbi:MAG: MBL fold metallo-hydrolase [Acidimicrobiales bacterium]|nr:MBL fold metallo-hydrolase [Acidimicrobiales bacterium]
MLSRLPFDNTADDERASRGLLGRRTEAIGNANAGSLGGTTWNTGSWAFVEGDAPDTVNPSLWAQAKRNGEHGLFEVTDGIYQVRGYDTSVVTFVATSSGWLVIDPLTTTETASAARRLVEEHLGERPVHAVIYTHSHIDHFGGILGVVSRDRIDAGDCTIIAPDGFLHAAVEENVVAQAAMGRRATWQYGMLLPWDPQGHVDQGLGKGVPIGTSVLVPPSVTITHTGQELTIDGVRVEFQLTPGAEAPAEMHVYFPERRALCLAENCTGTMHNIFTLRGALIRDALAWSRYLDEAIVRYADGIDLVFASHGWPHWGREDSIAHMRNHRDLYRWTHDQAMRLANRGLTPDEIADSIDLPPKLWEDWTCHGYYGTLSHNVRGVYQRHFGFYDGHPAHLHPHTPTDAAHRYVEFMGGMEQLVANARRSFDAGDYRWVVQVLRHAVFADPANTEARELQADACEQLGYQAEAGPWRDVYLSAATELRNGTPAIDHVVRPSTESIAGMTPTQVFDYLGVRLDGPAALELSQGRLRWRLSDRADVVMIELSNGSLHSRLVDASGSEEVDTEITSTRADLDRAAGTDIDLAAEIAAGTFAVTGDADLLVGIWQRLERFQMFFPIIER